MAAPDRLGGLADSVRSRADVPGGPVVVALSGGADSAVLAWAATGASETVRAVFVDHGLSASATLRGAAGAIAAALEIRFDVVEAPVDRDESSFEDAARSARYRAMESAAKPNETILTGHTADDQAETVLGHFLRGSGAAGLAGIPARRGRFARPLLAITRTETRALATELGLPFVDDPENQTSRPRRNRLRSELIPHLEQAFNPQLRSVLQRTAAVMGADDAALEALAARVPIGHDGEVYSIPAAVLEITAEAVSARTVRRALREMRSPYPGSHREIAAVLEVAAGVRAAAEITGAIRVEREGPMVVFSAGDLPPADAFRLTAPADVSFDRWRLTFTISDRSPRPRPISARTLVLDADHVAGDLTLRPPQADDRIDIGTGSKPVREALAEAGVPRRLRSRWPLLTSGERVALIPGVRAAGWAWPTDRTIRYFVAHIEVAGTDSPAEGT